MHGTLRFNIFHLYQFPDFHINKCLLESRYSIQLHTQAYEKLIKLWLLLLKNYFQLSLSLNLHKNHNSKRYLHYTPTNLIF